MLMDIAILENLGRIRGAGAFVKKNIEDTELRIMRWETEFAQSSGTWTCFSMFGYLAGVWLVAPAMIVAAFIFETNPNNKPEIALFVVACYFAAYTLYLAYTNLHEDKAKTIEKCTSPLVEKSATRTRG